MSRAIVSARGGPAARQGFPDLVRTTAAAVAAAPAPDTYRDRLFKYIPGEVVALHLFLSKTLAAATNAPRFLGWAIFVVGLIATPCYLRYAQKVSAPTQLAVSTVAFAVWIFALGEPFSAIEWYRPVYGALLLPVFTFFVALIDPPP